MYYVIFDYNVEENGSVTASAIPRPWQELADGRPTTIKNLREGHKPEISGDRPSPNVTQLQRWLSLDDYQEFEEGAQT